MNIIFLVQCVSYICIFTDLALKLYVTLGSSCQRGGNNTGLFVTSAVSNLLIVGNKKRGIILVIITLNVLNPLCIIVTDFTSLCNPAIKKRNKMARIK